VTILSQFAFGRITNSKTLKKSKEGKNEVK